MVEELFCAKANPVSRATICAKQKGFSLTAGRALDALARLSKAVGASADDWSVLIRIGEERAATRRGR